MVLVILYKCTAPVPQVLLIISRPISAFCVSVTWDVLKDQCYSTTATHGSYNGHETFDWLSQITIRALEGQPPVSLCHLPDCRCTEHSSPCTTRATLQPTQHYSGQWASPCRFQGLDTVAVVGGTAIPSMHTAAKRVVEARAVVREKVTPKKSIAALVQGVNDLTVR